jgi:hypothetical protein
VYESEADGSELLSNISSQRNAEQLPMKMLWKWYGTILYHYYP